MIFIEKVKDIEKIYNDLIEKAKEDSLNEIQKFKENQEEILTNITNKRKFVLDSALDNLKQRLNKETNKIQFKFISQIKELENIFKKNIGTLQDLIIKHLGFEF